MDLLIDYGCNCFPSKSASVSPLNSSKTWYHHQFNGTPIDELDQACLDVFLGYKCMFMDVEEAALTQGGPHGCYKGITYNWYFDENNSNKVMCGRPANPNYSTTNDGCKLAACQIEIKFAEKVLELIDFDPVGYKNSNLDKYNDCQVSKVNRQDMRDSCCGNFPDRYPFSSMTRECCSDGSVGSIGSCL